VLLPPPSPAALPVPEDDAAAPRTRRVALVFAAIVLLQLALALASIEVLEAVRAYVAGESRYAKGQKDAQIHLLRYAQQRREADRRAYLDAIAVPVGDRIAREALQAVPIDRERARAGFVQGGNHPDDVPRMIRLFEWGHDVPFMADAIATWETADRAIERLHRLGERVHADVAAGLDDGPGLQAMAVEGPVLNEELTLLQIRFSERLGEAARRTETLLLALNTGVALLLAGFGIAFIERSARARRAAQAALRAGALRTAQLVDAMRDGVLTVDAGGGIVQFNRAAEALFGLARQQALGQPLQALLPDFDVAGAAGAVREVTGRRADGSALPLEASVSRLETAEGRLATVVLRDMSELLLARGERQARAALEASDRAKTEFLSRMSHELRTPLNAVLGFAGLLHADPQSRLDARQRERVEHIERAGAHLLALVNEVLDLSRVESGQMALSLEAVDLRGVLREAVGMVSPLAATHAVAVSFDDGEPLQPMWTQADRVRLRQVLVNLLSNGIKYNQRGGAVRVTCVATGGEPVRWRVQVADTGRGIPPEQLAHLFEPFNRLGAENSGVDGTGIGLVLARRLTELMNGTLRIDSAAGHGTVATLELRRADRPVVALPDDAAATAPAPLDGRFDVLYAEDNEVNVELVRQVFALRPGIVLRVAGSGREAMALAAERPPDLLLADMNLGDMGGLDLLEALRADPRTAVVPLIAVSADAMPEQIRRAREAGFRDYVTKPIDFAKLLRAVDRVLAGPD
jgi:PAS domain S-box-containing protein